MTTQATILSNTTFKNTDNFVWRDISDEIVILELKSGEYYTMNAVGQSIWKALMEGKTVEQVKSVILGQYDVDENKASDDVDDFISEMLDKGVLHKLL